MNYLAHIALSGDSELIKIGNFMADHVKGKQYQLYSKKVRIGILLHRQIDSFTDSHELVRKSKRRLNDRYGHYRGVIIDIFYDHFLAKNWSDYSKTPLKVFCHLFYDSLINNKEILPDKIQYMMPFMIKEDWITNYANLDGIEKVLIGMNHRTKYKSNMNVAIHDLKEYYEDLEMDFKEYFKILHNFSVEKMREIELELDQ